MFKFIKFVGSLVVKAYQREAKALVKLAKAEDKLASKFAVAHVRAKEASIDATNKAAKVATDAQALSKFFSK